MPLEVATPALTVLRPRRFVVGQTWESRGEIGVDGELSQWTIVAITKHPTSPLVAQSECGAAREYRINGMYGDQPDTLDLVTLISGPAQ